MDGQELEVAEVKERPAVKWPLFNEPYEAMTETAQEFESEILAALKPVVDRWLDKVTPIRGLQAIATGSIDLYFAERILIRATKFRREERDRKENLKG